MATPIQVDGVQLPGDNMFPGQIEAAAKKIDSIGSKVSTQGGTVYTTWQGLSASYHAPEQEKLFTSMTPAKTKAESFGTDMGTASTALNTFAGEVRTIKAEVARIVTDARAFLSTINSDGYVKLLPDTPGLDPNSAEQQSKITTGQKWDEDGGSVDTNKALIHRMNDQQEKLWAAERICASALNAISGAGPVGTADPKTGKGGYGYADLPDNAEMPWGHAVERKEGCGESVVKGVFVDVAFNTLLQGVTSLVGFSWSGPEGVGFHGDTAKDTWLGLAHLVTMPGIGTMLLMPILPKPVREWEQDSEKTGVQFVAGLVGIDPYAKDPLAAWHKNGVRAAASSVANILTLVVPETKVGNLGKAGDVGRAGEVTSKAGIVARAAEVGRSLRTVTLEGISKISTKIDLGKTFKFGDVKIGDVSRSETGTGHTNLGGHNHADAPPARTDTDAGDHAGTGDHIGEGDQAGTGAHAGAGDHAGQHDGSGQHDAGPVHHGSSADALTGDPSSHAIAHDAKGFADDVTARAEKSTEHTQALHDRNDLAHQMGVDPKKLTVGEFPATLRELKSNGVAPQEIRQLRNLVDHEYTTARDLNRASENLGTTAARDYLKSHGDQVIVGDHSLPGKPGTLDTIGLSDDHSTLTVAEAKGGDGSTLGTRKVDGVKVQQGSTTYLNDLLHRDPDLKQYLQDHPDLARSIADGKTTIHYEMVKVRNTGRIEVTPFKLNLSDLHLDDLLDSTAVGGGK